MRDGKWYGEEDDKPDPRWLGPVLAIVGMVVLILIVWEALGNGLS